MHPHAPPTRSQCIQLPPFMWHGTDPVNESYPGATCFQSLGLESIWGAKLLPPQRGGWLYAVCDHLCSGTGAHSINKISYTEENAWNPHHFLLPQLKTSPRCLPCAAAWQGRWRWSPPAKSAQYILSLSTNKDCTVMQSWFDITWPKADAGDLFYAGPARGLLQNSWTPPRKGSHIRDEELRLEELLQLRSSKGFRYLFRDPVLGLHPSVALRLKASWSTWHLHRSQCNGALILTEALSQ